MKRKSKAKRVPEKTDKRIRPQITARYPPWLMPVFVFLLAFFLRLGAAIELQRTVLFQYPQLDSLEYYTWAKLLAGGTFAWPAPLPHGPGYAFFLAALLRIFEESLLSVRIVQALIGAGTATIVYLISATFFSTRAAFAAGLIVAGYSPLIFAEISLLAEGLFVFLALLSFYLVIRFPRASVAHACAGLCLGLAAVTRPTAFVLLPLFALVLWRQNQSRSTRIGALAAFTTVLFLVVAPVTIQNWRRTGAIIPVQGHGGFNFYVGNSPLGDGIAGLRVGGDWNRLLHEPARAGFDAVSADRYFVAKAIAEIREMPITYLELLGTKVLWFFQSEELRDSHSFYFFRKQSIVLRLAWGFTFLFPLAVLGAVYAVRNNTSAWPVAVAIVLFMLTCVGLVVGTRYRLPAIPFMAVYAGVGACGLLMRVSMRQWKRVGAALLVLTVSTGMTQVRRHPPSHAFAEELEFSGSALFGAGRIGEADAMFDRALQENPLWARAWMGKGMVALRESDVETALTLLQRAVQLDPHLHSAQYTLGQVYEIRGDASRARVAYMQAVESSPDYLPARKALLRLFLRLGDLENAGEQAAALASSHPEDPEPHLQLARIRGAQGRPAEGIAAVRATLAGKPDNPEAWFVLAMLSIDSRKSGQARAALEELRRVSHPNDPRIDLVRARLVILDGKEAETP